MVLSPVLNSFYTIPVSLLTSQTLTRAGIWCCNQVVLADEMCFQLGTGDKTRREFLCIMNKQKERFIEMKRLQGITFLLPSASLPSTAIIHGKALIELCSTVFAHPAQVPEFGLL